MSLTHYDSMVMRLRNEYHSDVRQSQARNKLASLRMKAFESKGMSVEAALTSTYQAVLTAQSFSHRRIPVRCFELNIFEMRWLATIGHGAVEPCIHSQARVPEAYGELQAALFQHQEAKRARIQDAASGVATKMDDDNEVSTFYQGQGRYERKHVGVGNRAVQQSTGDLTPLNYGVFQL